MSHLFRLGLIALFFAPALGLFPAHGKDTSDRKLHWLTPSQEETIINSLPLPPVAGSPEDEADLAVNLKAQAARTPEQAAQVLAEEHFSPKLFQPEIGPDFSPEHEPKLYELIKKACHEANVADRDAKDKWQRPRPFRAHPQVHPVLQADGLSYPSGHATAAYLCAVLLGEIFPDKKAALLQRAAQIAQDRVIGGVHYPSDIVAGEQFGRGIAQALLTNTSFLQSLDEAKEEAAAPAK